MKYFFAFIFLSMVLQPVFSQDTVTSGRNRNSGGIEYLAKLMEGSFSSHDQSAADTNFFDIRLHMKRIWKERTDGIWLYVEQAAASKPDKPYRQRVYRITETGNNVFESAVFTFSEPLNYAGDWKKENPLENLSPSDLKQRNGCSVFLSKNDDGTFSGSTVGKECESDLRNARYATSEVKISSDRLISWDRGFNEKDEQVWGATTGGYVFKRISE